MYVCMYQMNPPLAHQMNSPSRLTPRTCMGDEAPSDGLLGGGVEIGMWVHRWHPHTWERPISHLYDLIMPRPGGQVRLQSTGTRQSYSSSSSRQRPSTLEYLDLLNRFPVFQQRSAMCSWIYQSLCTICSVS